MPLFDYNSKTAFDDTYKRGAEWQWGHPNTRTEVTLHYHRFVQLPVKRQEITRLAGALGWNTNTRALIIGCGFGWSAEVLLTELGVADVAGTDTSAYIQAAKDTDEDADLMAAIQAVRSVDPRTGIPVADTQPLDPASGDGLRLFNAMRNAGAARSALASDVLGEDLADNRSRNAIRQRLGTGIDVVTEFVMENLTDVEAQGLHNRIAQIAGVASVTHYVGTNNHYPVGPRPTRSGGLITYNAKPLAVWKALIPDATWVSADLEVL